MQIKEISKLNQPTEQKPLTIWENSVHATHKFLNNDEILQIRNYVPQAFKQVEHLLLIIDHEQIKGLWESMIKKLKCSSLMRKHAARDMAANY